MKNLQEPQDDILIKGEWYEDLGGDGNCVVYSRWLGDRTFEFIESVWLDVTSQDEGYPDHNYCVIQAVVNVDDYTENDISCAISNHSIVEHPDLDNIYDLLPLSGALFHDHCMNDANVVKSNLTGKEAEDFVRNAAKK